MSELMEVMMGRRSIRKYEETPVTDEMVGLVLEAVKWAPSWANTQVWEMVVVRDSGIKEKLQATLSKGNPATKAVGNAPVVLAVCGKKASSGCYNGKVTTKFGDWIMFDLGLATQNLCLRAHELGLGTVIVGLFDHDRAAEILAVPEGYEVVALLPLGVPAKSPPAPKRREVGEFTHHDRF